MPKIKTIPKPILILVLMTLPAVGLVAYHTVPGFAQSVQQLQGEISDIESEISNSQERLEELRERENTLENRLETLKTEIEKAEAELAQTEQEIEGVQEEIAETKKELERTRELIQENARILYKNGDPNTLEIMFASDNLTDFIDRQEYLERVKDDLNDAAREAKELQAQLEDEKASLEQKRQEQSHQKQELQARREEQQRLLKETQGEESRYQERLEELKQQRKEAQEALSNINLSQIASDGPVEAGEAIGRVGNTGYSSGYHLHFEVRNNGAHTDPNPYLNDGWVRPTEGGITQAYGVSSSNYAGGVHPGIDYAGAGNPIIASSDGTLYKGCSDQILDIDRPAYGYVAIVDHGNGLESFYGHMEAPQGAPCDYAYGF